MKSLRNIIIGFIQMVLLFSTSYASADLNVNVRRGIDYLNYESNLEAIVMKYKGHFESRADHKYLDKLLKENKKQFDKWLWRFEPRSGGNVALRINGRVQAIISDMDANGRSYKLNGTPIAWTEGMSFKEYHEKNVAALKKNSVAGVFDTLFISEAHAIAPLLAFGLVAGGLAIAANEANAANAPRCEYTARPITVQSGGNQYSVQADELRPYRSNFRGGRMCSTRSMPRDFRRRLDMVRPNFRDNGKFNTDTNTQHRYDERCVRQYSSRMGGRPQAVQICKCIHRKQMSCQSGGWNMLEGMATSTCFTGYNGCRVPDRPRPQPQPNYPPPTSDDPLEIPTIICSSKTPQRQAQLCQSRGICCPDRPAYEQPDDPVDYTPVICSSKTRYQQAQICQQRGLCCPDESNGGNYDRPSSQ